MMNAVSWELSERADRRRLKRMGREIYTGIREGRAEMERLDRINCLYGYKRSRRVRLECSGIGPRLSAWEIVSRILTGALYAGSAALLVYMFILFFN